MEYFKNKLTFDIDTKYSTNTDFDIIAKLESVNNVDDIFAEIYVKDIAGQVFKFRVDTTKLKIPSLK